MILILERKMLDMKLFGVSLLTLVMILAVGYMVGVIYPGVGAGLKSKLGM